MPQGRLRRKLGRTSSHRKAMLNNMATSLFISGKIVTTEQKAKELKRYTDEIITVAKRGGLANIRKVKERIKNKEVLKKVFDNIVPATADRNSGYTSILRTGYRAGDRAKMVIVKLLTKEVEETKTK